MCAYENQDMTKEDLCFEWEPGVPKVEDILAVETELVNDYILIILFLTIRGFVVEYVDNDVDVDTDTSTETDAKI